MKLSRGRLSWYHNQLQSVDEECIIRNSVEECENWWWTILLRNMRSGHQILAEEGCLEVVVIRQASLSGTRSPNLAVIGYAIDGALLNLHASVNWNCSWKSPAVSTFCKVWRLTLRKWNSVKACTWTSDASSPGEKLVPFRFEQFWFYLDLHKPYEGL